MPGGPDLVGHRCANDCDQGGLRRAWLARKGLEKSDVRCPPSRTSKGYCSNSIADTTSLPRAIWRGYKKIKDSGGWPSLTFAGTGVYRFCKYELGFNEGLTTCLSQLASSFEVAADTLHPGYRQLLRVIGQDGPPRYQGHATSG